MNTHEVEKPTKKTNPPNQKIQPKTHWKSWKRRLECALTKTNLWLVSNLLNKIPTLTVTPWDYHAIVPGLILNKSLKTKGYQTRNRSIYIQVQSIYMTQNTKHKIVHQQKGSNKIGNTQWEETTLCADNLHMYETPNTCIVTKKDPFADTKHM